MTFDWLWMIVHGFITLFIQHDATAAVVRNGWLVYSRVWLLAGPAGALVDDRPLTVHTDMLLVARAMSRPDSGLEIRDRLWLKITVPRAFIGQSLHAVASTGHHRITAPC